MDIFAPSHLLILLLIILVIFGPAKLGDVGGALGRAIRDFKKAMSEPEQSPQATRTVGATVSAPTPTVAATSETTAVDTKADKSA
jgi:sec-independent protein translocase protein TatA